MNQPQVYLVGAGPGNPGLLTLRAVECLQRADLVIYDRLVPELALRHAPVTTQRVCITDLADTHPERAPHVHTLMIEAARQGKCVVRLKGGDPLLFGRGGEEALALREAGISYEIVPGVTAALGAAAFTGIPLTHRHCASAVAFVTGHEAGKADSALDWSALARFPGTLVFYMGLSRAGQIAQSLIEQGKAADTSVAIVHAATTGTQKTIEARLDQLEAAVKDTVLTSPILVIVGPVVGLRSQLAWFEQRPLYGKTVLVTRPLHQAADMVRQLEELGAVTFVLPAVEIRELQDWSAVDQVLRKLSSYGWLVFTSTNGVHALIRRLRQIGLDLRALGSLQLAVIGPATAEALRSYHLEPDLVPDEYRSESLAGALQARVKGKRVLLARADRGREILKEELAPFAEVEQLAVYSQVDVIEPSLAVMESLRQGVIEYVTLTSSNIARALLGQLDELAQRRIQEGKVKLISISPVTSATVRELGFPVTAEAKEYTTTGVIAALVQTLSANL